MAGYFSGCQINIWLAIFRVTGQIVTVNCELLMFCRMASEMFLYWGSGSSPSWRAMLVLELKGLSGYPNKLLSFEKREHKSEEVLKWNPRGQVRYLLLLLAGLLQ